MPQPLAPPPLCHTESDLVTTLTTFLKTVDKPLIVITGPTASGKTALSIRLAKRCNGEIINGDSRQFYQGMDLGTAKITEEEKEGIPHHLLSFLLPDARFTVAEFKELAEETITKILERKSIPLLVGGSGLFIDTICNNFRIPAGAPDFAFRQTLDDISTEELFARLLAIDPVSAQIATPHDRVRLLRTLEIFHATGLPPSQLKTKDPCPWQVFKIGIYVDPTVLEKRITARTEAIWEAGFLEEVKNLRARGFDETTPAMIAHGYREAIAVLRGEMSEAEAKALMTRNTRRYAKRQRTWWRKDEALYWVELDESAPIPQ